MIHRDLEPEGIRQSVHPLCLDGGSGTKGSFHFNHGSFSDDLDPSFSMPFLPPLNIPSPQCPVQSQNAALLLPVMISIPLGVPALRHFSAHCGGFHTWNKRLRLSWESLDRLSHSSYSITGVSSPAFGPLCPSGPREVGF